MTKLLQALAETLSAGANVDWISLKSINWFHFRAGRLKFASGK